MALSWPSGSWAQSIRPGDNLVVEGIPPIPSGLVAEVGRYTEARSAAFFGWHPARREVLIATRFANARQVHHVRTPGGARTQLTFEAEPIARASFQPKTGAYFVFQKDTGGNEFHQLYRYDVADGRTTLVTDGKSRNDDFVWSTRGDRLAYTSTRRNGTNTDLYIVDPALPKSDRLLAEMATAQAIPLDWSPDDETLLVLEWVSIARSRLWLVSTKTGQRTPLTDDEDVAFGAGVFAGDGRAVWATTDKGREFLQLVHIDLGSRTVTPVPTGVEWNIDQIDLSPDGHQLAFTTNEAGLSRVYLLDTRSRRARVLKDVPEGVVHGAIWHPNGRELGMSIETGGAPVDVFSVEISSGTVTRWTESELGGMARSALSGPALIRWTSFDQREITGFIHSPASRFSGRRPVIINIHGGPEAQYRPGFQGRMNYYLQELGVAVIYPNVRGSDGYGKTFLALDNGLKREDSVKDIGALLDWIAKQPQLDPSRVLVTGGSYGGYMTLAVATHYPDRIRAAVDIVGISNFNTFLRNTESYRRDRRRVEYGDEREPEMAAFFERISPLNNASKISKPLFVIQGGNDPRVPKTESEQVVARVREQGSPVWYLMAKDEGHGFAKKANQDFQFYATVMFVRQHLLSDRTN